MPNYYMSPTFLTLFAMLAFAANSVHCRLALTSNAGEASIAVLGGVYLTIKPVKKY